MHTWKLVKPVMLQKNYGLKFRLYSNPNSRDSTSHWYLIEYKKHNYYIHATLVYVYNSPISHQNEGVIVIVYWSHYPDEIMHVEYVMTKNKYIPRC